MSKPRVLSCVPSRGYGRIEALLSEYALATNGKTQVIPGMSVSSLLAYGFNTLWASALTFAKAGMIDYFLMHHDDVEIKTHRWLDIMIEELNRVGAAALSVVQPIKSDMGESSTAVEARNPWNPRKLTMAEVWRLPETFSAADLNPDWSKGGPGGLLVNTGLLLVDLRRPEFQRTIANGPYEECEFYFTIRDRIILKPDGTYTAHLQPEDWNFSRQLNAAGLPVYATWKVDCRHHGFMEWPNRPPQKDVVGDDWFDFAEVYREAVANVPDGGSMVEVGCWRGRSMAFMLKEAKKSGKQLSIYGVDHFKGSCDQPGMRAAAAVMDVKGDFLNNCDTAEYPFFLIERPSLEAVNKFADSSLDFVFIDASHDYDSVKADIEAWLPKVKPGGTIGGHDYDAQSDPGVIQAVMETIGGARVVGRCWLHEVGQPALV